MPNTTHGLWYPDQTTKLAPLHTLLGNMQSSNEAALVTTDKAIEDNITLYGERAFATAAARDAWYTAHPSPALVAGMKCRVAGITQRYDGSIWRVGTPWGERLIVKGTNTLLASTTYTAVPAISATATLTTGGMVFLTSQVDVQFAANCTYAGARITGHGASESHLYNSPELANTSRNMLRPSALFLAPAGTLTMSMEMYKSGSGNCTLYSVRWEIFAEGGVTP